MSEQAPETPAGRGRTPSRSDGTFTRKIGPLPMWQWLLIALGMLGVYVIFAYRKQNQKANAANNSAAGAGTGGTTDSSQVPQFVNQTYTTVTPPVVNVPPPNVTINTPQGEPHPTPPPKPTPTPAPTPTPSASLTQSPWSALGISNPGSQAGGNTTLGQLLQSMSKSGYSLNNLTIGGQLYNVPSTGAGAGPNHVASQYLNRPVISATPYSNKTVNVAI